MFRSTILSNRSPNEMKLSQIIYIQCTWIISKISGNFEFSVDCFLLVSKEENSIFRYPHKFQAIAYQEFVLLKIWIEHIQRKSSHWRQERRKKIDWQVQFRGQATRLYQRCYPVFTNEQWKEVSRGFLSNVPLLLSTLIFHAAWKFWTSSNRS
jgi:hypothetical protein